MLTNMRQIRKARLLAGAGNTHPLAMASLMKGWREPNNPASCYKCGLLGPCSHDLKVGDKRFKHSKAIADAGHVTDGKGLIAVMEDNNGTD